MSINISTSDYLKGKDVTIDGVDFKVRAVNSSESIALINIGEQMKKAENDTKAIEKSLKQSADIFFGLFDDEEKARKMLGDLSMEVQWEIYNKIHGKSEVADV